VKEAPLLPKQATISVRGDKLRATLGIELKGGEFLTALIEQEIDERAAEASRADE
jgi:hypothetical protein